MCRNIKVLANFEPPATPDEIRASALQFVRKLSGTTKPSKANEAAFNLAVEEVTATANRLIASLVTAVELALAHLPLDAPGRVLDLATGSGAIALAIAHERPRLQVIGTDLAAEAVDVARRNALRLHVRNVEFRAGDWYEPVRDEHFTLVVSNPPYVAEGDTRVERAVHRFEPHVALFAGPDGLDALRIVIGEASRHLVIGGWLVVEHGDGQGPDARTLLVQAGFADVVTRRDLAGLDRCTEGRWAG